MNNQDLNLSQDEHNELNYRDLKRNFYARQEKY